MFRMPISSGQRAGRRAQEQPAQHPATAHCPLRTAHSEKGFTLAGLLVILTIMMVFIAYTVPRQWSKVMQRERERQTIFVMKQYARAIREWSSKHGGAPPASLDQLKEARLPRVMRGPKGEYTDPLTGKLDWILVPPTAVQVSGTPAGGIGTGGVGVGGAPPTTTAPPTTGTQGPQYTLNKDASPKDYVGPFIGVRPPVTGPAMVKFKDTETYDQWVYTILDLKVDIENATKLNPNQ
jgi:type II secretory pathway pseudopilin PulG